MTQLKELAEGCGFSHTGGLAADSLRALPEVREACAADKCKTYGKNWSCPPACGTLEECERRIRQYRAALILQTSGGLEDSFDYEAMSAIACAHNAHLRDFHEKLRDIDGGQFLLLGSGACKVCETCSCPGSPCRFPEKMIVSMEAMGLLVSEVCRAAGLPYYYGPNTLTYSGCLLMNLEQRCAGHC
jgi:predicted metal-binding protein